MKRLIIIMVIFFSGLHCVQVAGDIKSNVGVNVPGVSYTISGIVTGLNSPTNGMSIANKTSDLLFINTNGQFTFANSMQTGDTYDITIATQPTGPNQTCTVTNGTGTVQSSNITNIAIACSPPAYNINVLVSGLVATSTGLNIYNGMDSMVVTANGVITISTNQMNGTPYSITKIDPVSPVQACTISNGTGVIQSSDVTNIMVVCSPPANYFSIAGTLSGLNSSTSGIILDLNSTEQLVLTADGMFNFLTQLSNLDSYTVTILSAPEMTNPLDATLVITQTCSVANGTGISPVADVTNIAVTCLPISIPYAVGGVINGLAGLSDGVTISMNYSGSSAGTETSVFTGGNFSMNTWLYNLDTYTLTIAANPLSPPQVCTISAGGAGTISGANVSSIIVDCSAVQFNIGGTITGLPSGSTITLQNNGANNLLLSVNGMFTFLNKLTDGSLYNITILTQPAGAICSVSMGTGTVSGVDVQSALITCSTLTYTVGGALSGYNGSNLVISNNGLENVTVTSGSTAFTFPTAIPDGGAYNVTIITQPSSPSQTCSVSNGAGNVPALDALSNPVNVSDIAINCITNTYAFSGTITGLSGSGLQISLSSGGTAIETQNISNGATSFAFNSKLNDLSGYSVTVATQPSSLSQTCSVTNGSGSLSGADITNIAITCTTNSYTISGTITGLGGATGLQLKLNAYVPVIIAANSTSFNFNSTPLADGSFYSVSIAAQPSAPTACSINSGSGTLNGANISNVSVSCASVTFSVSGNVVWNAAASAGLNLALNGNSASAIAITSGATTFSFGTQTVVQGGSYTVTVSTQPSALLLCSVSNGSGSNVQANITNVLVTCNTDNPPVANAGAYSGYYQNNTLFLNASASTDDGLVSSFFWSTTAANCTFTNNNSTSGTNTYINCSFDTTIYQAVQYISVNVRVTDNRGQQTTSGYVGFYIFNPQFVFVTPTGTGTGLDPNNPAGSIQTGVTNASSYGKTFVAVQYGTYTVTSSYVANMVAGVSVIGRYYSTFTGRYSRTSTLQSTVHQNYTAGTAYGFYFNGTSFTNTTIIDGIEIRRIQPTLVQYFYGFYINGGSPVIRDNIVRNQSSSYGYGVFCSSCSSLIERNLIDQESYTTVATTGVYVTTAAAPNINNNMIRNTYGYGVYIYNTTTNEVMVINNTIINNNATNTFANSGVFLHAATTGSNTYTSIVNNLIYAMYGVYEYTVSTDPRRVYNNNFTGPTGYTAVRDFDAGCAGSSLCTAAQLDIYNVGTFDSGNVELATTIVSSTSAITAYPMSFSTSLTGLALNVRYGGMAWSYLGNYTLDFFGTTRTNVNGGATNSGAAGWTIGADEVD